MVGKGLGKILQKEYENQVPSVKTLRQTIGFLGILLPIICVLGGLIFHADGVQDSISIYYYTNMRDFFVGVMFLVGLFLIHYKGPQFMDNLLTSFTGIFGLLLGVFPCYTPNPDHVLVGIFQLPKDFSNILHLSSAALFFIFLGIQSFFLFTRTGEDPTPEKIHRNWLYRISALVIWVSILTIPLLGLFISPSFLVRYRVILIFEAVMLVAFGISWLIKGEVLLKDTSH